MALFGKGKGEKIRDLENDVASLRVGISILHEQFEALQTTIKELTDTQKTPERISTWGNAKTIPIQHDSYALVGNK
jgi:prefoldin subunit 5